MFDKPNNGLETNMPKSQKKKSEIIETPVQEKPVKPVDGSREREVVGNDSSMSPEETQERILEIKKQLQQEDQSEGQKRRFENGETVCHCEGKCSMRAHPDGVVICRQAEKGNEEFLLNGTKLLYKGKSIDWQSHPDGIVISQQAGNGNYKFLLNGTELIYEGKSIEWKPGEEGVVMCRSTEGGVREYLLNGTESLYKGKHEFGGWRTHQKGVVIARPAMFGKKTKFLLNGSELICKEKADSWESHPDGVVIVQRTKDGDSELLLNGKKSLYKGKFLNWQPHPKGVVVCRETGDGQCEWLINGTELVYKGKNDGWASHDEGIIVRNGSDWKYYEGNDSSV